MTNEELAALELSVAKTIEDAIGNNWNSNGYWHPKKPLEFIADALKPLVEAVDSGTCKECRWWDGPAEREQFNEGGHAKCNHEKVSAHSDKHPDGAQDSEGYGGIFTGPDFGCIHFEAKEPTA